MMKDIEGKELEKGDLVICSTSASSGYIVKGIITRFTPTTVKIKKLRSNGKLDDYEDGITYPSDQIYKVEKCQ